MNAPHLVAYLPSHADTLLKVAEDKDESPGRRAVKAVGTGLLGLGAGTAAGFGVGLLADAISKRVRGQPIPLNIVVPVAALAGVGSSVAHQLYKAKELKELQNAYASAQHRSGQSEPGHKPAGEPAVVRAGSIR